MGMARTDIAKFSVHILIAPFLLSCKPDAESVTNSSHGIASGNYPKIATHMYTIDFAISAAGDSLFLIADSQELLVANCKMILDYANYLRLRNNQSPLRESPSDCMPESITDTDKKTFRHPSGPNYSKDNFFPSFLDSASKKIDITKIFPEKVFSRSKRSVIYDGICFNSALVGSGIFGLSHYSRFAPPVEGLLGYLRPAIRPSQKGLSLIFQRTPWFAEIVKSEKSWAATSENVDVLKSEMSDYIRTHFSPGSMLCLSSDRLSTAAEKAAELKSLIGKSGSSTLSSIQVPDPKAILGKSGAHCATFITPHLLLESSNTSPHNFVSWAKAFPYYWNWMGGKQISFHYTQINPSGVLSWSKKSRLFHPSSPFSSLQNELRSFHNAYDSRPVITAGEMSALLGKLKTKLQGESFRNFINKKSGSQSEDFDSETELAFEYWNSVLESISKMESTLVSLSPTDPWQSPEQ